MSFQEWLSVLQSFGLPVAALGFIAWAIANVSKWIAMHILSPLLKRHLEFLDHLDARLSAQTDTQVQLSLALAAIQQAVATSAALQSEVLTRQSTTHDLLAKVLIEMTRRPGAGLAPGERPDPAGPQG